MCNKGVKPDTKVVDKEGGCVQKIIQLWMGEAGGHQRPECKHSGSLSAKENFSHKLQAIFVLLCGRLYISFFLQFNIRQVTVILNGS